MEPKVVKTERRGRKRKRKDGGVADKTAAGKRSRVFVGRYVKKEFDGVGAFLGKIVSYDTGLYRVDYEDGDFEDLESGEVKAFIVGDKEMNADFHKRRKVLDEYVLKKYAKEKAVPPNDTACKVEALRNDSIETGNGDAGKVETVRTDSGRIDNGVELANVEKVENSVRGGAFEINGAQAEVDSESSSDFSDCEQSGDLVEVGLSSVPPPPLAPPPQLPPSSGNFGISKEHVPFLLSVYSFLRSFSVCLFLSPFGLDEFVGALNSSVPNTLLDAIHVALIRALKSHVDILSAEGSELASKCLRNMDWSLLDSLTWPMFIVQYLTTMRHAEGSEWKEFYVNVLEKDYYTLSAGRKLIVLQILCDGALDSAEIRAEIDMREESEFGPDPDVVLAFTEPTTTSRRGRPRKNQEPAKDSSEIQTKTLPSTPNSSVANAKVPGSFGADVDEDGNVDECRLCGMDGTLVCCDGCPLAYHSRCIGIMKMFMPEGAWYCPECTIKKTGSIVTKVTSLRGAEIFGIDPYQQVFLGSCNHLLVMNAMKSSDSDIHIRYYSPVDIQKVLHALTDSAEYKTLYLEICKGILDYWKIPEHIFSLSDSNGVQESEVVVAETVNGAPESNMKESDTTCISENGKSDMNSNLEMTNVPSLIKEANLLGGQSNMYMGLSFKPQAYLNVYIPGDFAASAAASLAILSTEEKLGNSQTQPSTSSHRKLMSANYSLQTKAFLAAAKRFFWPNYEKKLVEVPRERCGWCLSCQVAANSRRGCLLNSAASNAIKGPAKVLATMRQSKCMEGSLASIATYVMFMEESLYGLTLGNFQSANYRNQWRKQVEEAATLGEIKSLLLEFERNIRSIAFSADWVKLVDDLGIEKQVASTAKTVAGPAQKRGPGRPGRKPAVVVPEITDSDGKDASAELAWWGGGMLSKHIFQKGLLPQKMIKHAARLGGSGKINGVQYVDGLMVPKRSRQFLWRAAVEMCKTASQLALQVRYLDFYVRWSELARPDQPIVDGKGPETEASAFRNACIVDKRTSGNKISYGVVFENQKHLPSRVLKNVLEVEQTGENKKDKYWFIEMRIPLYLIKEYEMAEVVLPNSDKNIATSAIPKKKQFKSTSVKNIFSFLSHKRDNNGKCLCSFCQLDVPFRIATRCNTCEGYCHEQCAVKSKELLITCKKCYREVEVKLPQKENDSPTSPLLLQKQEVQHPSTVIKLGKLNGAIKPVEHSNQSSQKKLTIKKSGKKLPDQSAQKVNTNTNGSTKKKSNKSAPLTLGLIWKKRNIDETGIDFRLKNLLLKNNPNGHLLAPQCHLCSKPYDSSLMYIHCEGCKKWYHADAVGLQESAIMDLLGFKCCRCRRIRIPVCPYTDPETRLKLEAKKKVLFKSKTAENLGSDSNNTETNEWEGDASATPVFESEEVLNVEEDEKPVYSFPAVEEADCGVPKKLPVRRHVKEVEVPAPFPAGESSTPVVEWDVSGNGFGDDMMFDYGDLNYEDMEFEPQTYFSFNELLADDGGQVDRGEGPPGEPVNPSINDCNPEAYQLGMSYDHNQEPMFSVDSGVDMMPCRICSQTEPCPDLFCQICGLWIHQHCSPWDDDEASWEPETGWKCGNCREWR